MTDNERKETYWTFSQKYQLELESTSLTGKQDINTNTKDKYLFRLLLFERQLFWVLKMTIY